MNKRFLTPSLSIAVLLALVLAALISSKHSRVDGSAPDCASADSSPQDSSQQTSPSSHQNKTLSENARNTPHHPKSKTNLSRKNSTAPQRPAEQSIRQLLSRSEEGLTYEVLSDGTELIHLNGSQGHLSTASLSPDGSIQVQCHNNPEELHNQISSTPSPPAAESGPPLLTK